MKGLSTDILAWEELILQDHFVPRMHVESALLLQLDGEHVDLFGVHHGPVFVLKLNLPAAWRLLCRTVATHVPSRHISILLSLLAENLGGAGRACCPLTCE